MKLYRVYIFCHRHDTDAGLLPSPRAARRCARDRSEAGMNIVDLGLVYDVAVSADGYAW